MVMQHTTSRAAISPARRCAYCVLRRVFERGAYADRALQSEAAGLDARDRALAMRLAYGAIQRRGTLDVLLEQLAERPITRLQPPIVAALRLGLYELLYTQGAPHYAVVADAVELAKADSRAGHGLVNAVLRRAVREGPETLLATLGEDTAARAAVMHSHPRWVAEQWWRTLGADGARALMAADNEPGEVALRANALVVGADELAARLPVRTHAHPWLAEALVLDEPFDAHGAQQWQEGAFIAQSRAAMLVARALDPQPGERVLDLCAAPGGKSTHIAALMGGSGEVVAVERNANRARSLEHTAQRMRARNVHVVVADAREPLARAPFDRVLVDPPCSGLGTLQARADLRWRVTPERVAQMAVVQAQILACAAAAVRPGGVLVYSTCTISAAENEHLIAAFLDSRPAFALDDLAVERPELSLACAVPSAGALAGTLQTLPNRDRTAGFFIARMRRSQ